jgi:hypothetical protein
MTDAATTTTPATTKDNNSKPKKAPAPVSKPKHELPKGFTDQSSDIIGFYDPDHQEAIHFIPKEAILQDSKLDPKKVSILIIGELVADCQLAPGGEDTGEVIDGKSGDQIGIWAKPGMRSLRNLAGAEVYMYPDGAKDTGKPNPMTVFKIGAKTRGEKLPVIEDRRDKSRLVETWLDINIKEKTKF